MRLALAAMFVVLALEAPPVAAAEEELARIEEGCVTVRRQLGPACACFSDMARSELDDQEQALLAAWMTNDYDEAARLLRDELTLDQASAVGRFAEAKLTFCAQYS
jgi:hypothetical protein